MLDFETNFVLRISVDLQQKFLLVHRWLSWRNANIANTGRNYQIVVTFLVQVIFDKNFHPVLVVVKSF